MSAGYPLYLACARCGKLVKVGESRLLLSNMWDDSVDKTHTSGVNYQYLAHILEKPCSGCKQKFVPARERLSPTKNFFLAKMISFFFPPETKFLPQNAPNVIIPPFWDGDAKKTEAKWQQKAQNGGLMEGEIPKQTG